MIENVALISLSNNVDLVRILVGCVFAFFAFLFWKKGLFSRVVKKITHPKFPSKRDAEQNREVYTELVELRALTSADRVYVMRFHNGTEFLPSKSAWKISCTHEVVKHGVTYESARLQGILVSRIPNIINPVILGSSSSDGVVIHDCVGCPFVKKCVKENRKLVIINVDEMSGSYCKFHLESQNIKTVILCGMSTVSGVYGLVGLDFCDAKLKNEVIQDVVRRLCRSADNLQYHFKFKKVPSSDSNTNVEI